MLDLTLCSLGGFGTGMALATVGALGLVPVVPVWLLVLGGALLIALIAAAVRFPAARKELVGGALLLGALVAAGIGQHRLASGLQRQGDLQRGKRAVREIHRDRQRAAGAVQGGVNASVAREDEIHGASEEARASVRTEAAAAEDDGRPEQPVDLPS